MSTEFKEKELNIQKRIEEKTGCSIDILKNNRHIIKEMYQSKFSTAAIKGKSDFINIYCGVYGKEDKDLGTLAEKCIKRANMIEGLSFLFYEDGFIMDEIRDANMFWNFIQYEILPLEILWGMEMMKNSGVSFCQKEQRVFEYLIKMAEFYLNETSKLAARLAKENKKREKILKKQGFQLKIATKSVI